MTDDDPALPLLMARGIAAGRVAIGVAATFAPSAAARFQFGSAPPALRVAVQMLGVRDLALGLGALLAARRGSAQLRGWVEAGALADGVDAAAFLRWGRRAGVRAPRLTAVVATTAATSGAWAARQLTD